ncbi:MAG: hypothetical protein HY812_11640 [Planctomycetes bacterium]|nr:hypothetical protein [Planctomycetota bacterium]
MPLVRTSLWKARDLLAAALLLGLPFLIYAPALRGEFASDDYRFIVQNGENLDRLRTPWVFFTEPLTNSDRGDGDIYRPLRTLSFAIDRKIFGAATLGYHLHSVALHGLVALLAYRLLLGTFGRAARRAALLGALLFAVHPLATEAVCWVSSRADLQATALLLLSLLLARRGEARGGSLGGAVLAGAAAGFAKETAVALPLLYLLEHRVRSGRWLKGAGRSFSALAAGCALYLAAYFTVMERGITGQVGFYEGSFSAHLPYGLIGLARAWRLALAPLGQSFLWETNLFQPLCAAEVALASAGLLATLAGVCLAWRRCPGLALGIVWFFVAVLPAANVFLPLRTVLAERFAYAPLLGLALAAAAAAAAPGGAGRRTAWCVLALLPVLAASAALRAHDWSTQERLYEAELKAHPGSYAGHLGLGGVLMRRAEQSPRGEPSRQDLERARALFARAVEIARGDPPRGLEAAYALGHACVLLQDWDGAVAALAPVDAAFAERPDLRQLVRHGADALYDLGLALSRRFDLVEAAAVFERLIAEYGEAPRWLDALGETRRALLQGRAMDDYLRALEIDPDYHDARVHLAEMMFQIPGLEGEARRQAKEVLARDPANEKARRLLEQQRE